MGSFVNPVKGVMRCLGSYKSVLGSSPKGWPWCIRMWPNLEHADAESVGTKFNKADRPITCSLMV